MKALFESVCLMAVSAGVVFGMPTDTEMEKAKPLLRALTSGSFAEMRAGRKSRIEVAEELMGFAAQADTEAARFQLIQSAFNLFMGEGNCARTLEAFVKLREGVRDVPDGLFGKWTESSITKLAKAGNADGMAFLLEAALDMGDSKSALMLAQRVKAAFPRPMGRLAAAQIQVMEVSRRQKELSGLRAAIKAAVKTDKPAAALHERYGFELATDGDWKGALDEFTSAEGDIAEIARLERSTERQSGDAWRIAAFWWDQSEKMKGEMAKAFRSHAAGWYRIALTDGSLTGLKKTLAEKRIDEVEKAVTVSFDAAALAPIPLVSARKAGFPISVNMGNGVVMEFVPIPAGTFTMGYEDVPHYCYHPHKVTITRPFWIGKFPVTVSQWTRSGRQENFYHSELREDLGGENIPAVRHSRDDAEDFAEDMTARFKNNLPIGYVFRLPTAAEREYACRANGDPAKDWYAKAEITGEEYQTYCWTIEERLRVLKSKGINLDPHTPLVKFWYINFPPVAVGTKPGNRNAWGVFDIRGNVHEFLLDTFPESVYLHENECRANMSPQSAQWNGMNIDPLFWDASPTAHASAAWLLWPGGYEDNIKILKRDLKEKLIGFRLVIGPDLVKEMRNGKEAK